MAAAKISDAEALNFLNASEPLIGLGPVLDEQRHRQEGDATVEWTARNVRTGEHAASRGSVGVEGWWRPRAAPSGSSSWCSVAEKLCSSKSV